MTPSPSAGDVAKLVEELRAGLDGVTPGPWEFFPPEGGGWREPYSSAGLYNENCDKVIDCEWASATEVGQRTYQHIARCSPDNIAKLLDALESLSRDLAGARAALAEAERDRDEHAGFCAEAIEQRAAAEARSATLETALEPFAKAAADCDVEDDLRIGVVKPADIIWESAPATSITFGDLDRARSVLPQKENNHD